MLGACWLVLVVSGHARLGVLLVVSGLPRLGVLLVLWGRSEARLRRRRRKKGGRLLVVSGLHRLEVLLGACQGGWLRERSCCLKLRRLVQHVLQRRLLRSLLQQVLSRRCLRWHWSPLEVPWMGSHEALAF